MSSLGHAHDPRRLPAFPRAYRFWGRFDDLPLTLRRVLLPVGLSIAAVAAGWLIANGHAAVVGALVVLVAFVALAVVAPAQLAALLLLGVLNGIPVVDLSGRLPGGLKFQDACVFALGALLLAYHDKNQTGDRARITRAATIWSAAFISWWTFAVARSVLLDGVPVLKAMLFGRDFLYFAVLLPFAAGARFPRSSLRAAAWVLLAGLIAYSVGAIAVGVSGVGLAWLIHPGIVDPSSGVTRVYALMAALVNTCLIFAVAFLLSKSPKRHRWRVGAFAALLALAAALQLTRANYFALGAALVVGMCVAMMRFRTLAPVVVRAIVGILVLTAVALTLSIFGKAAEGHIVSTLGSRLETGVSDLFHSSGTVGYRETVDRQMLHVLGSSWPIGLGFLPPSYHYVSTLPSGTIRNSDTGVFNLLMTMGIVGVLFVYAPLAYGMRELIGAHRRKSQELPRWIIYGGVGWIVWVVASSPTTGVLFGTSGLVVTTLLLTSLALVVEQPGILTEENDRRPIKAQAPSPSRIAGGPTHA